MTTQAYRLGLFSHRFKSGPRNSPLRSMRSSSRLTLLAFVVGLCLTAGLIFSIPNATASAELIKLAASDGTAGALFGTSVAVSGDTAVVGAPDESDGVNPVTGAAYVYTREGGTWTEQAKLTASDGAAGDRFGWSVAISGHTIVVSAWWDDIGTNPDQGSAYVFTRTGETWTEQAKLTASDGLRLDQFGYSVGVSHDVAIVGASPEIELGVDPRQGSAYVFARIGGTWAQQEKLTPSNGFAGDRFGVRVGLDGDTAVVGAGSDNAGQGSAYVFTRTGGTWAEQDKLTASDGAAGDEFGFWVAVSGESVVVGAFRDDVTFTDQGSAYVFTRSGGNWTEQAKLVASDGAERDLFGRSVAVSGDTIVVGAQWDDVGTNVSGDDGSGYVFTRTGSTWPEKVHLTAPDGTDGDLFGVSVGVSGDTAVVGASFAKVGANPAQGAAYVWSNGATSAETVSIDVKPGDNANRIRTSSNEAIAVAVLTDATFDAATVDPSTVCFGDEPPPGGTTSYTQPSGVDADCNEAHRKGHVEDADGDGDLDMVLHFETSQTGIDAGDTEARLTGKTRGGTPFQGSDSIRTVR